MFSKTFYKSISSSIYVGINWSKRDNRKFLYFLVFIQWKLWLYFCKTFCTFFSVAFVWSELSLTNWLVLSICKHLSVYLSLFIITTSLPLSAFKIPISLLSDSSLTNFLYLRGAFILVYLSQVFLSFVLISRNSFSEMLEMSFSKPW